MALKKIFIKNLVDIFFGFIYVVCNELTQSNSVNVIFKSDMTIEIDNSVIES
jgi:hypothetical protein